MPHSPRLLVLLAALLVAGCSSDDGPPFRSQPAGPQQVELGWEERSGAEGLALVFRVHRLEVSAEGWEADVEIENRTGIPWELGADRVAVEQSFGVMLFATGELGEVERRGRDGDLPGLRAAQSFVPPLPARLAAGGRWRGTASARGRLAAGRYLRVVFGPLVAVGEPPGEMPSRFSWITDHAYRLRR